MYLNIFLMNIKAFFIKKKYDDDDDDEKLS